jgi:SOS-response transcriptional repressor LexA
MFSIANIVNELIKSNFGEKPDLKRVSRIIGIKYTTFRDMLTKDYESWQSKYLNKVSDYFSVSVDYLLGRTENLTKSFREIDTTKIKSVPVFGAVQCGSPAYSWDSSEVRKYIDLPDMAKFKDAFGVIAKGDSMKPFINPGDYLLCADLPELIKDGRAVISVFVGTVDNQEINAKLVKEDKNNNIITLYSINTKYPPQNYHKSEIFKLYKLIKIIRDVK